MGVGLVDGLSLVVFVTVGGDTGEGDGLSPVDVPLVGSKLGCMEGTALFGAPIQDFLPFGSLPAKQQS